MSFNHYLPHVLVLPEDDAHISAMGRFRERFIILLIDFDNKETRLQGVKSKVPTHLTDRVFVLGTLSEPEDLKGDFGTYETIGRALARDCREGTDETWSHPLLQHNAPEVDRLRGQVRAILFP